MPDPHVAYAWASTPLRWATAGGVTLAFALAARVMRGVNTSGAVAGGLACLLLFVGIGPAAFGALAVLFLMTWLSTRFGYGRKRERGLAESREGRNGWQVSANLAVAGISSLLFGLSGNHAWSAASVAALAEAATDTVASEVGQTYGRTAILITTWETVPSGTDGGLTLIGTLCGAAAGMIVVAVAVLGGMVAPAQFWIPAGAGVAGMLLDSLLGATAQRQGRMSNEAVNVWGTTAAAMVAYAVVILLRG